MKCQFLTEKNQLYLFAEFEEFRNKIFKKKLKLNHTGQLEVRFNFNPLFLNLPFNMKNFLTNYFYPRIIEIHWDCSSIG